MGEWPVRTHTTFNDYIHHLVWSWFMALQNNCKSDIKDQRSHITVTDIIIIKTFEILWELLKFETEINSDGKNGAHRFAQCRVTINLQFVRNEISVKHNKVKCKYKKRPPVL